MARTMRRLQKCMFLGETAPSGPLLSAAWLSVYFRAHGEPLSLSLLKIHLLAQNPQPGKVWMVDKLPSLPCGKGTRLLPVLTLLALTCCLDPSSLTRMKFQPRRAAGVVKPGTLQPGAGTRMLPFIAFLSKPRSSQAVLSHH